MAPRLHATGPQPSNRSWAAWPRRYHFEPATEGSLHAEQDMEEQLVWRVI